MAFRILLDTMPDCYLALGHVEACGSRKMAASRTSSLTPRPTATEALHTTVFCLDDRLVEIQIRTSAMHDLAEYRRRYALAL